MGHTCTIHQKTPWMPINSHLAHCNYKCIYTHILICVYTHTHTYMCIYICIYTRTQVYVYVYGCVCMCVCVGVWVCVCVSVYICVCVYAHACMRACVCAHVREYVHIYTIPIYMYLFRMHSSSLCQQSLSMRGLYTLVTYMYCILHSIFGTNVWLH